MHPNTFIHSARRLAISKATVRSSSPSLPFIYTCKPERTETVPNMSGRNIETLLSYHCLTGMLFVLIDKIHLYLFTL